MRSRESDVKLRELGNGGPEVGEIGLGCMSFAGFYGPTTEVKDHPNRFEIATKGSFWRAKEATRPINNTKEHLTEELDKSLKRLGVDLFGSVTFEYSTRGCGWAGDGRSKRVFALDPAARTGRDPSLP